MNAAVRITLYVALSILAIWLGLGFARNYKEVSAEKKASRTLASTNTVDAYPITADTNAVATVSNIASAATHVLTAGTNSTAETTNSPSFATNTVTTTGSNPAIPEVVGQTTAVSTAPVEDDGTAQIAPGLRTIQARHSAVMVKYLVGLVATLVGLGLLIARDLSRTVGGQAVDFLFNEDAVGVRRPEYDAAEQMWATGDFLEAIRLLREYYTANPREVFVAIRIAEIYEKDLKNLLAAALEYEEILTKSLPPSKWSWTAIHLCNLHSKMGQSDKSLALLRRIAVEYGETPGAEKARKRLSQIDPTFLAKMTITTLASEATDRAPKKPSKPGKDDSDSQNLPSGFRPRK